MKTPKRLKPKNPQQKARNSHDKNELEHYKGLVRELQKRIRGLERELSFFSKRKHFDEAVEEVQEEEFTSPPPPKKRCEECARGHYDEFEIADKVIGTCNICGNRKRLK